jgi:hypothetical protein
MTAKSVLKVVVTHDPSGSLSQPVPSAPDHAAALS